MIKSTVKISYVINVYNGEPFIFYNLKSIYKHAHQIIIVEGVYEGFAEKPHSSDNTTRVIKNFPDPEKKIRLITKDKFWKDRKDMCNAFLKGVTGDVIWQLDYDEFYFGRTHKFVRELFEKYQDLDLIIFPIKDFFGSLDYEIKGYMDVAGLSEVRRVFRFSPGVTWKSQGPPTLASSGGKEIIPRRIIDANFMASQGHFMWHYTSLFRTQLLSKIEYYRKFYKSYVPGEEFLLMLWDEFRNPFNVSMSNRGLSYLKRYEGSHPPIIYEMMEKIDNKVFSIHPKLKKIENYLNSPLYYFDVFTVKIINDLLFKRKFRFSLIFVFPLIAIGALFSYKYRFVFTVIFNKIVSFIKNYKKRKQVSY